MSRSIPRRKLTDAGMRDVAVRESLTWLRQADAALTKIEALWFAVDGSEHMVRAIEERRQALVELHDLVNDQLEPEAAAGS